MGWRVEREAIRYPFRLCFLRVLASRDNITFYFTWHKHEKIKFARNMLMNEKHFAQNMLMKYHNINTFEHSVQFA